MPREILILLTEIPLRRPTLTRYSLTAPPAGSPPSYREPAPWRSARGRRPAVLSRSPFPRSLGRAGLFLLLCALSLLGGCAARQAPAPDSPAPGAFVRADGSPVPLETLADMAADADYILLGERHDNAVDHRAQAAFVEQAARRGPRPVLGLEMLPRRRFSRQLEAFSQGGLALEALPAALDWPSSWGFDFALYKPVFAVAERYRLPVAGLNIPHDIRAAVSRKGLSGLTARERAELPERIIPPTPEQRTMLAEFFNTHSTMLRGAVRRPAPTLPASAGGNARTSAPAAGPGGDFDRFLLVQSLWDSTMAEEAVRAKRLAQGPVIILAGVGHVENGWGIAHRLVQFDPGARILLAVPYSGPSPEPGRADLYYFSPQMRSGYGIRLARRDGALAVSGVMPGSPAARAGLKAGDILREADGRPLASPADLHRAALQARRSNTPLALQVERDGTPVQMTLGPGKDGTAEAAGK